MAFLRRERKKKEKGEKVYSSGEKTNGFLVFDPPRFGAHLLRLVPGALKLVRIGRKNWGEPRPIEKNGGRGSQSKDRRITG